MVNCDFVHAVVTQFRWVWGTLERSSQVGAHIVTPTHAGLPREYGELADVTDLTRAHRCDPLPMVPGGIDPLVSLPVIAHPVSPFLVASFELGTFVFLGSPPKLLLMQSRCLRRPAPARGIQAARGDLDSRVECSDNNRHILVEGIRSSPSSLTAHANFSSVGLIQRRGCPIPRTCRCTSRRRVQPALAGPWWPTCPHNQTGVTPSPR